MVAGAGGVLLPTPASAHVRLLSEGAEAGKPATLKFRVPSEKEVSTTVRIAITLPEGVSADSVPAVKGWTISRAAGNGMANGGSSIVWTAKPGNEVQPAETQTFTVRAAPLPKVGILRFDTAQTYSDGSVVNWNQPTTGGQEPEFPSPELVLDPDAVPEAPPGGEPEEQSHSAINEAPELSATPRADMAAEPAEGQDIPLAVVSVAGTLAAVGLAALARRLRRRSAHSGRKH
ncbi:DUF1775 domain-containing protein [Actinomadura sp. KC06]|uniref:DUF1775 domain-containing protein n=1 Tax=Actinomadura sp. KC06 TaxID=2530369 RepID=UPI001404D588|nr:DUF1775 domain-containing protein [Actinomadura sp. KC06]